MNELRTRSLAMALFFTTAASTAAVIGGDLGLIALPSGALSMWLTVQVLCLICAALRVQRSYIAAFVWTVGTGAVLAMQYRTSNETGILTLIGLWSFWCALLFNRVSSGMLLLLLWSAVGLSPATMPAFLLAAASMGAVWLLNMILYQVLETSTQYRQYAVLQMNEAREHRGHLAKVTKALHESKNDLERANTQLNHLRRVTEEARLAKAQFVANVSHEIRTPINLIVGFSEMLLQTPHDQVPALADSFWTSIQTIMRNSRHLQSLINDVLDMSQLDAGQMALMREEVDPRQMMLETAELLREAVKGKGLRLSIELPETLPGLLLDRIRIRQVILNLLGNAIRFTDTGTITLSAAAEQSHLLIRVRDTGIGIPPAELDRVFEEFHQLDASMSRRYGGSGLGLTLSKRFVEQHEGQLYVESTGLAGEGSTFTIELPLQAVLHESYPVNSALPYQIGGRYFLVYDEDKAVRMLFDRHAVKHRPVTTASLDELVRLSGTIHPTAIVLDDNAPLERIRNVLSAAHNQTPLIICSMPSGKRAVEKYGVADCLIKPVSAEGLLSAVERLSPSLDSIMIVDDEHEIVRLFAQILEGHNYRTRKAYNGREALEFMTRRPPQAVILDLVMPEMNGLEVIAAMHAVPALATIPIILTSAASGIEAVNTRTPGMLTLNKPSGFLPLELVGCVEALIDHLTPATFPVVR